MEKFNLKEYLANPSRKLVTRAGHSVRIICTDRKAFKVEPSRKVVGLVDMRYCEEVKIWDEKGNYYDKNSISSYDLFFAPGKQEGWVNVYLDEKIGEMCCRYVFNSEEEARRNRGEGAIATVKIEWEE